MQMIESFLRRTTHHYAILANTETGDYTLLDLEGQSSDAEALLAAHPEVAEHRLRYVGLVALEGRRSVCDTLQGTQVFDDRRTAVCAFQSLPVELVENVRIEFEGFASTPWWCLPTNTTHTIDA